jgi:phosphoribosylformylglycinamidine (FGAM) synthase-like enzyme
MNDQNKDLQEQPPESTEPPESAEPPESTEPPERQEDQLEKLKETTEKLWDSTLHAFSSATFKATQYKKLVQKKIDLSALHKKIGTAHAELGKLIDDLREAGRKSIMTQQEVKTLLLRLDDYKAEAATLEEEIERIRAEVPAQQEDPSEETSG